MNLSTRRMDFGVFLGYLGLTLGHATPLLQLTTAIYETGHVESLELLHAKVVKELRVLSIYCLVYYPVVH